MAETDSRRSGQFFVVDGPDGAGKSTQVLRLATRLRARGAEVDLLREPGGTPAGEELRRLLLDPATEVVPVTEMLLYQAARAQLVATRILPALRAGRTVVLDRYYYSTVAYQGFGLGLDPDEVRRVSLVATGGLEPDRALFLDLAPEAALERLGGERDRIERRPLEFHRRVREGFLAEAARLGSRAAVLDAREAADTVAEAAADAVGLS